ncbi:hypothetical protein OF820_00855 [Oceanotoga sp. DSM 15011]|jgi:cell division protein FtsA|uniref:cell division FtsA domain-containing protein n=1 Tax=Oceanotoga TaxID=1255275 RepID=UPI0021F4378C|nr:MULTISPECIES: cell division FtsA domain-containing protein [Oceanotoga]MDN5341649.1 cell division protein FtsA [Oceanotoga sp.]MDO7977149.1 hypothetical protein [Oceanotoga teriensis]UYP00246.1 hypothetical protein OF820_00855 [Oceanotoga sp. DSM 15011]
MAKEYLIGLDIGSYYTKGILFEYENDKFKPLNYKKIKSDGIINGEIQDVEAIRQTITSIINSFQNELPKKTKNVEVAIGYSTNNLYIDQENYTAEYSQKKEIKDSDLKKIKNHIVSKYTDESKIILDSKFMKFILDNKSVRNPISFFVQESLSTSLNIVWVPENSFALLINVFKNIIVDSQIPIYDSALSAAYAVTNANDRDIGVTVIDFGYHMCRIVIFKNGIPKLYYAFSYGMKYVLKDICNVLKTSEDEAHRLLVEEAVCLRDTKTIKKIDFELISGSGYSYVSQNLLNKIVFARIREIISRLNGELSKIGYEKTSEVGALQGGIVITGGGSNLKNVDMTIKDLMGSNFRKGNLTLNMFYEVPDELKNDPEFLPVFGIVERFRLDMIESVDNTNQNAEPTQDKKEKKEKNKKGFFKSIMQKLTGGEDDAF